MGVPARNTAVPSASPKPVFALVTTKTGTTARRTGAARDTRLFQTITDFSLTAAVSISSGLTPCGRSVSVTIPASNPQVRNGCGRATAQVQRISTHWLTSLLWLLLWPPFCPALTPTVHPNHPGEALKVCSCIALLNFPPGLVFMRFFSLPGDSRFLLSSPFCFRTCFAHLYVFVGLGIFTPMPLISTPSSAGMRIYRRPSMTRASIMWLYSGATAIFTSGVVI